MSGCTEIIQKLAFIPFLTTLLMECKGLYIHIGESLRLSLFYL
uniref:Uncharacterized protein n=2 Tax=Anguilla anguilla TaxID=7936 RepID=A0A0E9QSY3_ANGAN